MISSKLISAYLFFMANSDQSKIIYKKHIL